MTLKFEVVVLYGVVVTKIPKYIQCTSVRFNPTMIRLHFYEVLLVFLASGLGNPKGLVMAVAKGLQGTKVPLLGEVVVTRSMATT